MRAHSPSGLKLASTCPRWFHEERVRGDVLPVEPHPATVRGLEVHAELERRVRDREPIRSAELMVLDRFLTAREKGGDLIESEQAFGLDHDMRPCGFHAEDVWIRGRADIVGLQRGGAKAWVVDLKTGKRRDPWWPQLGFYATVLFALHPALAEVWMAFYWSQEEDWDGATWQRPHGHRSLVILERRLRELEAQTEWRPRPSGLCRDFCPVKPERCEFKR